MIGELLPTSTHFENDLDESEEKSWQEGLDSGEAILLPGVGRIEIEVP